MLGVGGGCLGEKPWHIKSPLINYSGSYTVRCKIYPNSCLGNLKVGRYEHGHCEITPYKAFIGKHNGVMIIVNKVNVKYLSGWIGITIEDVGYAKSC